MSINVLVVDDSAVMRRMVIKALTDSGLELGHIYEASNGRQGIDVADSHAVDVVLLDVHMPVMSGVEMFQHLRGDPRHKALPVVFITSESSSQRIHDFVAKGAGFIHKPWTPEELRAQILEVTGNHG